MTSESSQRRAAWRAGSVVAAVAGSAVFVAAVVARRQSRLRLRHAVATPLARSTTAYADAVAPTAEGPDGTAAAPAPGTGPADGPGVRDGEAAPEAELRPAEPESEPEQEPAGAGKAGLAGWTAAPVDDPPAFPTSAARVPLYPTGTPPAPAGPIGAPPVAAGPTGPSPAPADPSGALPVAVGPIEAPPVAADPIEAVGPPAASGGRRWAIAAVAVVVLVAGIAAAVVVAGVGAGTDDQAEPSALGGSGTTTTQSPTSTVDALTADEAFAQAAARLEAAGSFTYTGTSQATDVSLVRPGLWLGVRLSVAGEVDLAAGRLHETATDGDGRAAETATDGTTVWGRLGSSPTALGDQSYQTIGEQSADVPRRVGAMLLPTWLAASVDRQALPVDATGRRSFRATVPAALVGEVQDGRAAVPVDLVLVLDDAGDPVHVEAATAPDGPALRLVFDLTQLGQPVAVSVPGDAG